jgi:hypothetical protein
VNRKRRAAAFRTLRRAYYLECHFGVWQFVRWTGWLQAQPDMYSFKDMRAWLMQKEARER